MEEDRSQTAFADGTFVKIKTSRVFKFEPSLQNLLPILLPKFVDAPNLEQRVEAFELLISLLTQDLRTDIKPTVDAFCGFLQCDNFEENDDDVIEVKTILNPPSIVDHRDNSLKSASWNGSYRGGISIRRL
jgi:hypothetical protein